MALKSYSFGSVPGFQCASIPVADEERVLGTEGKGAVGVSLERRDSAAES